MRSLHFFRVAAVAARIAGFKENNIERTAILRKKYRDEKSRSEWALMDSKGKKVLRWFGLEKPSEERIEKEEKRIQYFKHQGSKQASLNVPQVKQKWRDKLKGFNIVDAWTIERDGQEFDVLIAGSGSEPVQAKIYGPPEDSYPGEPGGAEDVVAIHPDTGEFIELTPDEESSIAEILYEKYMESDEPGQEYEPPDESDRGFYSSKTCKYCGKGSDRGDGYCCDKCKEAGLGHEKFSSE